ncbi:MAG: hypothetical protein E5Y77_05935 [Mesorhizobium sp.]|nr:MAG: hypothetical protein E5Y77_05935 [Mesorhizobium sp.]
MRGVPAWHRRHSVQHPSSGSAQRADPPSPTRGEGKAPLSFPVPPPAHPAIPRQKCRARGRGRR